MKQEKKLTTADGRVIQDLKELALVMSDLSDEVFNKHVSDSKNDFAEWVRCVAKDEELAQHLMNSLSKEGHKKIILRHITKNYVDE